MKLLAMGSCRVQTSLRKYKKMKESPTKLYLFFPLLHTVEQFAQAIKLLKTNKVPETDVFDMRWGQAKCTEITKDNKLGKIIKPEEADVVVIEVCGSRNYICNHGNYLYSFPQFYKKHIKKDYGICYSDLIFLQLEKIYSLLNKKPLILVSNHNIHKKESRVKIIKILEQFAKDKKNIRFCNPTSLILKEGVDRCLKNENHFKLHFMFLQAQNIIRLAEEIA